MKPEQISSHPAFAQRWYYVMELAPGLYTPGEVRSNVALTRHLLRNVEACEGVRCLDVGAQEGLVSVLLNRRGADVVAYDRVFSEDRLGLVRDALDAEFELIGQPISSETEGTALGRGRPAPGVGMPLPRLRAELAERDHPPFDVVVFSGVLYHVYDPLAALATVRGLVRTGGIVVLETAAVFNERLSLHLNAAGRFTASAIWLPSLGCLDYLLRLVRLEPLDIAFTGRGRGRLAVACRAVDGPPAGPQDDFINSSLHDYELSEYLDWPAVSSTDAPIDYRASERERIDLLEEVRSGRPYRPQPEETRLDLGARF